MILVDLGRISFPIGIFWAGFCRRKTVPGGRKDCGRRGRPELPKKEVPGAMVALVDPVVRVRRGWLATSPPGGSGHERGGFLLIQKEMQNQLGYAVCDQMLDKMTHNFDKRFSHF